MKFFFCCSYVIMLCSQQKKMFFHAVSHCKYSIFLPLYKPHTALVLLQSVPRGLIIAQQSTAQLLSVNSRNIKAIQLSWKTNKIIITLDIPGLHFCLLIQTCHVYRTQKIWYELAMKHSNGILGVLPWT